MPPGLGPRLRHLLEKFHESFDAVAEQHPCIRDALGQLETRVAEALPRFQAPRLKRKRGRPEQEIVDKVRRLQNQLRWARRGKAAAQAALASLQRAKDAQKHNRICPRFLAKVALSYPSTCARAFAGAWRDVVGEGTMGVSRTSIDRIRSAFADVCKDICRMQVRIATTAACGVASSAAGGGSRPLVCAALLHIHDEASLRLRSSAETQPGMPARSRSSKVQQHVTVLHLLGQQPVRWLVELDTLADKTAETLANSLQRVLRPVGQAISEALDCPPHAQRPWLVHCLVGDGVSTNEAAAKILLAALRREPLPGGLTYFLVAVKCSSHQANLAVGTSVSGRAALIGAASAAQGARTSTFAGKSVCGAVVRLFKYLVSDYEEEFMSNLQGLVQRLRARPAHPRSAELRQASMALRELYGSGVIPDALLDICNGGVAEWTHVVEDAAAIAPGYLESKRDDLLRLLRKRILVVDEQPTLTRMFTFTGHLECLLLIRFLNLLPDLIQMRATQPRQRSRKRIDKVLAFMSAGDTDQYLRRTCLALQLVGHVTAICGQMGKGEPLLVRLSKGAVQRAVAEDLGRLLGSLHLDPQLDLAGAVSLLVATSVEVVLRFDQYSVWPGAGWRLCQKYNQEGYMVACVEFLGLAEDQLDYGFGVPLRQLARLAGVREVDQLRWLSSAPVQAALANAFEATAASSLPVERAFAETKRSEAPRLCHVSTAGRNQLLKQFLRQRQELLATTTKSAEEVRKVGCHNSQSLAWQMRKETIGRGPEMRRFVDDHAGELAKELQRRRGAAAAGSASPPMDGKLPLSESEWVQWFTDNEDDFHRRMLIAPDQRKRLNQRLHPAPDTPAPAPRLLPDCARPNMLALQRWQRLGWGRSGWFCATLRPKATAAFFLYEFRRRTYLVDITYLRDGRGYNLGPNCANGLLAGVTRLERASWDMHEVEVLFQATISASASPAGVRLEVVGAKVVSEPLKTAACRKKKTAPVARGSVPARGAREPDSDTSSDSASGGTDEVVLEELEADVRGSSGESSCPSVDTDVDSGLDEVLVAAQDLKSGPDAGASDLEDPDAAIAEREGSAPGAGVAIGGPRHPAGTWTIWGNTWVYITKTPLFIDIKCCIRGPLRNADGGVGLRDLSKTVSPHHYGESWGEPVRSLLLLRSWALWRVQQGGWAAARPCRQRELSRELQRLETDLRAALGEAAKAPLFGVPKAHRLFCTWVPDIVGLLLG